MTTGATGQLGLALPVQGELSGTWGDTVNNGITQYTNIAIAATLTLTNDGAVTLANTTGDASASNIVSSLTGAGTVTAQFAIVRVTGTLTVAKVVTAPSYSKTYTVVNAATGGIVTFKAAGQTGVSIAVGESAFVYFNGTDYVKVAGTTSGSAGGSNTQVQFNSSGALAGSANLTFDGTTLVANSFTDSSLTSGRVTYATTAGNLTDSANLLYSGTDLTVYGLTVGRGAGAVATNTALGASALAANTSGVDNHAVGYLAMTTNTSGSYNVALGSGALKVSNANQNAAFGHATLFGNTSGANNTAIGSLALNANLTASNNTAVGKSSLIANTTGASNTAVGTEALQANLTASNNTAVGYQAGYSNTTGAFNTWVGGLEQNNSNATGRNNTTGNFNTALGNGASALTTTGSNNTTIGYQAGYTPTTANENTFVGFKAGFVKTTGDANTFIGNQSGVAATTGITNTFLGASSGSSVTTGSKNTILGSYNGNQGSLDIRTASNYIVLSDGDGNPRMYSDNNGVLYDQNGKLRAVPQSGSSKTSSYTLATTDVGEYILLGASGAIVIPDATFAAGDVITIFNNTASTATITCSITTAYIAGTFTDKATMTLAAAGVATVLFITSTLCVVSGNVT